MFYSVLVFSIQAVFRGEKINIPRAVLSTMGSTEANQGATLNVYIEWTFVGLNARDCIIGQKQCCLDWCSSLKNTPSSIKYQKLLP